MNTICCDEKYVIELLYDKKEDFSLEDVEEDNTTTASSTVHQRPICYIPLED